MQNQSSVKTQTTHTTHTFIMTFHFFSFQSISFLIKTALLFSSYNTNAYV